MPFQKWFNKTVKNVTPLSEWQLYFRVKIFGLLVFVLCYAYTSWLKTPGVLNKSVADTSVILIGLSMLLSGLCYFLNIFDTKIIYRKHLGLIGFAFGLVHLFLSWEAFQILFMTETWQNNAMWAQLTGTIAIVIFAIMALISNRFSALKLGGIVWRKILRTGYVALALVLAHVVILKMVRWQKWFDEGMQTPPSISLMLAVFMVIVILMRILLWGALKKRQASMKIK